MALYRERLEEKIKRTEAGLEAARQRLAGVQGQKAAWNQAKEAADAREREAADWVDNRRSERELATEELARAIARATRVGQELVDAEAALKRVQAVNLVELAGYREVQTRVEVAEGDVRDREAALERFRAKRAELEMQAAAKAERAAHAGTPRRRVFPSLERAVEAIHAGDE